MIINTPKGCKFNDYYTHTGIQDTAVCVHASMHVCVCGGLISFAVVL